MSESKYQSPVDKASITSQRVGVSASEQISAFRMSKNLVVSSFGLKAHRMCNYIVVSRISNINPTSSVFMNCTMY